MDESYSRRVLLSTAALLSAGCLGKSAKQTARQRAAEFWNAQETAFDDAQALLNEAYHRYDGGFYPRSQEKGRRCEREYSTLEMRAESRAEAANSEYERELIHLIRDVARHGGTAGNHLMDASALSQRDPHQWTGLANTRAPSTSTSDSRTRRSTS